MRGLTVYSHREIMSMRASLL